MKTAPKLVKSSRITQVGIVLLTVIALAGMSCTGTPAVKYTLTITSTAGGNVTAPGVGNFSRNAGTIVDLIATPDAGYHFVKWTGNVGTVADVSARLTNITMDNSYSITADFAFGPQNIPEVAASLFHTVGLKSDGTALAAGPSGGSPPDFGQCDIGNWTDIVQVAAGAGCTVGLKSNGTVIAVGENTYGECDVGSWANVAQVSAGWFQTVGLKSDGTVVAAGLPPQFVDYGQSDVGDWTDIIQVAAGGLDTVGLASNGTVVVVGDNDFGQCNVDNWTNIVQVSAGMAHTVGLRSDGTVVAVGDNTYGQCDVGNWTDIVQVASAGGISSVFAGSGLPDSGSTFGLKSDGTVLAVGNDDYGQCDIGGWDLN